MGPQRGPLVAGQILEWDDDGLPIYFVPPEAVAGKGAGRGRGRVLGTSSAGSLPAPEQERGFPDGDCRGSCLLGVALILGRVFEV